MSGCRIYVDYGELTEVAREIRKAVADLESSTGVFDLANNGVEHPVLDAAIGDFEKKWSDRRKEVCESLDEAANAVDQVAETFRSIDTGLADGLDDMDFGPIPDSTWDMPDRTTGDRDGGGPVAGSGGSETGPPPSAPDPRGPSGPGGAGMPGISGGMGAAGVGAAVGIGGTAAMGTGAPPPIRPGEHGGPGSSSPHGTPTAPGPIPGSPLSPPPPPEPPTTTEPPPPPEPPTTTEPPPPPEPPTATTPIDPAPELDDPDEEPDGFGDEPRGEDPEESDGGDCAPGSDENSGDDHDAPDPAEDEDRESKPGEEPDGPGAGSEPENPIEDRGNEEPIGATGGIRPPSTPLTAAGAAGTGGVLGARIGRPDAAARPIRPDEPAAAARPGAEPLTRPDRPVETVTHPSAPASETPERSEADGAWEEAGVSETPEIDQRPGGSPLMDGGSARSIGAMLGGTSTTMAGVGPLRGSGDRPPTKPSSSDPSDDEREDEADRRGDER